jgi:Lsr2
MARSVITQLVSGLSGDEIAAGAGEAIEFSYRGASYSIDLTDKEAAGFDKAIALSLKHATKTGGRLGVRARARRATTAQRTSGSGRRRRALTCPSEAGFLATS